jgi:hypothetical protein
MTDFSLVDEAVISSLTTDELEEAVVYIADEVLSPGQTFFGSEEISVGHPYLIAFIDRRPGANWMHSCRYLVIDAESHRVQSVESDRPPVFGSLPPYWRVARKAAGVEEWQLLKISCANDWASSGNGGR